MTVDGRFEALFQHHFFDILTLFLILVFFFIMRVHTVATYVAEVVLLLAHFAAAYLAVFISIHQVIHSSCVNQVIH